MKKRDLPKRVLRVIGQKGDQPLLVVFRRVEKRRRRRGHRGEASLFPSGESDGDLYEQFANPGIATYKTLKNAVKQSTNFDQEIGLALIYRPDDLEPMNITADERVAFYKEQVEKWGKRLLESGLFPDEMAVVCEEMMLRWGHLMKHYTSKE